MTYNPYASDTRDAATKILDINNRLEEMPRLRKQEEDNRRHTPETLNKALERIAKTEDILKRTKLELEATL